MRGYTFVWQKIHHIFSPRASRSISLKVVVVVVGGGGVVLLVGTHSKNLKIELLVIKERWRI